MDILRRERSSADELIGRWYTRQPQQSLILPDFENGTADFAEGVTRTGNTAHHGNSRYGRSTIGPSSGPRQCGVMNRSSWSFHPGLARRR